MGLRTSATDCPCSLAYESMLSDTLTDRNKIPAYLSSVV